MLLEVPQMAAHPFDKPKGLSRFRKLLGESFCFLIFTFDFWLVLISNSTFRSL